MQYRYDALGRRTHKILHRHDEPDAEIMTFHWQGLQMVGEQSSRSPDHRVQYLYSEGSREPLARVDIDGDSQQTFWYHTDLNGLPERLTDEEGDVVWRGRFSSWGETEYESGGSRLAVPQNLRFQGQYLDRETGLHYNLFRYYDPVMGRFTQPDPVGLVGGINQYAYVKNPLTWIDPLGLSGDPIGSENNPFGSSRAARRDGMRQAGIPTSQQPISQSKNSSGWEYRYEVLKPGGGTIPATVQQQTMDVSHPDQPHWEAGKVKVDPRTGETRMNDYGRPKIANPKGKAYNKKCGS